MALYNEILAGRYNRALQKIFGIKGEAPSPQLAGEIAATIGMFYGVENRYVEGWQRFAIAANPGVPAAGNRSAVRIRMPANSGVIGVIERLSFFKGNTTSSPAIMYDSIAKVMPTDSVANTGERSFDSRQQQTNSKPIVSQSINFGVLGTVAFFADATSAVPFELVWDENQEIVLPPGSQLTVADDTLADAIVVSIMWRERPIEDSEKAF